MNTRKAHPHISTILAAVVLASIQSSRAADTFKLNVTGGLNNTARWNAGIPGVGTNAVWDSRVTSVGSNDIQVSMTWGGIRVSNAAVRCRVGQTASTTLTVQDGGINMTNASNDFEIECNAMFTNSQSWNVAAGRTLFYVRQMDVAGNTTVTISNAGTISGNAGGSCVIRVGTTSSGTSIINQTAGTVIGNQSGAANVLNIGKTAGSIGIYNLSGGTIDADDVTNDKIHIADLVGCDGRLNVSGGQIFAQVINVGNDGAGTLTLNGTGTITMIGNLNVPNASGTGLVNLDGGTLTTPKVAQVSGVGTFNFNGGILRPTGSRTDFLQGLATVLVKDNGTRIDTAGFDITIAQLLQHGGVAVTDGGVIKSGAGTLTLSGANTYNGPHQINAGKLVVTTAHAGGGSFTVGDGAALGVTIASAGSSLNTSSLILGTSTGATSEFNLGSGNPTANIINATSLETHGTVTVNVSGVGLSAGQFTLIKYTGSIAGSGFAAFTLGTLPLGVSASLVNNTGNSSVDLNITAAPKLLWTAATDSNWDIATTTNWLDSLSSSPTYYTDGLPVLFDDTAPSGAVQILASVSPALTIVSNNSLAYSFGGAGAIAAGGLTKLGSATLTLNSAQTYPGDTTINAGTLSVATTESLPDGTGKGNVVVNGTLDLAGVNEMVNGLSGSGAVSASSGAPILTVGNNNSSSSFAGTIQNGSGTLALTKTGSGILSLSGNNSYSGDTTLSAGTVQIGHNNAFGSSTVRWNAGTISSDGLSARNIPNTFVVAANVTIGNVINSGPLTLSGPMSFISTTRTFTCNSDATFSGSLSDGGINKLGPGNLTLKGGASLTVDSESRVGAIVLDGASVNTTFDFRPDASTLNGIARLVLTNGAALSLDASTANLRAGFDGAATATNIIDAAGTVTMPNADSSNGSCILGTGSKRGILNLMSGGDVEVRSVVTASGREGEINFNGGTLRIRSASSSFIQVNDANVLNGGAVFDTAGFDITVAQKLQAAGSGGLTKNGAGTLTLTATNTYTGATIANGGKVIVPSAQSGGGALTVNDGAAAQVKLSAANSSFNSSTVTLGASAGATTEFNLVAFGNPTAPVINAASLATHGTVTVNVSGSGLSAGQFVLINYTGAIGGSGFAAFSLSSLPLGVTANLVNNTGNTSVDLQITAVAPVLWTGSNNGDWDIGSTPNWRINATPTTYQEPAVPGPAVRFDDTASGTPLVNVTTVVSPASVTVSNNSLGYSFSGSGKISGPSSLTKQGSGTTTINTPNDYSGPTLVSAGTLALGASDVLPDGAGKSDVTVSSGASLDLAGFSDTVNGLIGSGTINASAGASILRVGSNDVSSSFSGLVQNTGGTLGFHKIGSGTFTLSGNNSYAGGTVISNGSVQLGHNNAAGAGIITLGGGNLSSDSSTARTLANNLVVPTASGLGNEVNNGLLTLNGSMDFGGAGRNLYCSNDVVMTGSMSNGALTKEGDNTTITTSGNADFIAGAEVHRGTWIIAGGTITNTDSTRPDVNLAGRLARLVVTNGGAIVLTGTGVNGRVGFTGGDVTMTNVLDLAGLYTMPNTIGTTAGEMTIGRNSSHGILNLYPGADLSCRHMIRATTGVGNYGEANFDGGILRSTTNDPVFINGLDLLTIRSRGATIDTAEFTIGTTVPFQDGGGGGGLTKLGVGTFMMNGTNTYPGATVVSAGTLGGNGVIAGPVRVASGAAIAPGTSIGKLTINNSLTLSNGSTTVIELDKSALTNDAIVGLTGVAYAGTLSVTNLNGTLAGGDIFPIFSSSSYSGSFAVIVPSTPGPGLGWDTSQLGIDGTLRVLATTATNPTNITVAVTGGSLDLSWPEDHTGWILQMRTNGLEIVTGTNWFPVAGSSITNRIIIPIGPGNAFFRLNLP